MTNTSTDPMRAGEALPDATNPATASDVSVEAQGVALGISTPKPDTAYELLEAVAQRIEAEPRRYDQREWVRETECGTVCCRAGWVVAIADPDVFATHDAQAVGERADQILGLPESVLWNELYSTTCIRTRANPGTAEYAAAGARGVREFMAVHEAHLKARKLADVPPIAGASK